MPSKQVEDVYNAGGFDGGPLGRGRPVYRQKFNAMKDEVVVDGRAVCAVVVRREVGVYADERQIVADQWGEELIQHIIRHLSK